MSLSRGKLIDIMNGNKPEKPVLQIIGFKLMPASRGSAERYRIVISDGDNSVSSAMLGTQLNDRVKSGEINENCVVCLENYMCNVLGSAGDNQRKILVIFGIDVLQNGKAVNGILGAPQPYKATTNNAKPATNSVSNGNKENSNSDNPPPAKKPIPSNYYSNNNSKIAASPMSGTPGKVADISSIMPFLNRWTIKARVMSKSAVRTWSNSKGEGKLFSVVFGDKSGEIKATAFRSEVDRFYDVFEQNKCYFISKGQIKTADKRYNNTSHDYELVLNPETTVEPCTEDNGSDLPSLTFNFVKFSKLMEIEPNSLIDIVGVAKEATEVSSFVSKSTNKQLRKREVTLVDDTATSVRLTLWGDDADNNDCSGRHVLVIKNVKVSDFGGRSLSCLNSSQILKDPDIPQAHTLQGWFLKNEETTTFKEYQADRSGSAGTNSMGSGGGDIRPLMHLKNSCIAGDKAEYFSSIACILQVKLDNALYKACPKENCNKKLSDQGDSRYRCEKCQETTTEYKYRLLLQMNIADHTHQIWVTAFQDTAETILGKKTEDIGKMYETV